MNEAQVKALLEAELTPLRAENAASKAEAARLRETLALRDARDFAQAKLAKIDLPQATKDRLAESLPARATLKDGALDEAAFATVIEAAVKAEGEYLKAAGIGTGRISGMGSATPVTEAVKPEALAAEFRAMGLSETAARIAAEGRAA